MPLFYELGRWWDKNTEIDLVGLNKYDNTILFVETKWNTKPLEIQVLEDLKRKAKNVKWGSKKRKEYYALAAKGGFSDNLINTAKKEGVVLIHRDQVVGERSAHL